MRTGHIILTEVNHLPTGSMGVNHTLISGMGWWRRREKGGRPSALLRYSLGSRWGGGVAAACYEGHRHTGATVTVSGVHYTSVHALVQLLYVICVFMHVCGSGTEEQLSRKWSSPTGCPALCGTSHKSCHFCFYCRPKWVFTMHLVFCWDFLVLYQGQWAHWWSSQDLENAKTLEISKLMNK